MSYQELPDPVSPGTEQKHYGISAVEKSQIEKAFTYHTPKVDQRERYIQIRDAARNLVELFNDLAPASRERSLAITKTEEAVMWANAAIARNE